MEPLFENRYLSSHKVTAEFIRKYRNVRWQVAAVFWFAVILLTVYLWSVDDYRKMITVLCISVACAILVVVMPDWTVARSQKQIAKRNGGVRPETVVTCSEIIELHEGMVHLTIEYHQIQKVVHLKHSYVLMLGKTNGVIIYPDCFTKGTFEEFKQFLREKRPDLTVPE